MASRNRITGIVCGLLVAVLAINLALGLRGPDARTNPLLAENVGCPASTNLLGTISVSGDCTIATGTVWGNGTLTLAGNLYLNSGASLTLWNVALLFAPASDQQFALRVDGGTLVMHGGSLRSATPFNWHLETNADAASRVDLEGTSVSQAGGGKTSGFLLNAGSGDRFLNLAVSASALGSGSGTAVINIAGASVSDVIVSRSSFDGTGPILTVNGGIRGANLVFSGNRVTHFDTSGGAPVLTAGNTQILDNVLDANGGVGIEVFGGGPGWPAKNSYNVSGNTITTTNDAIVTSGSAGYDVTWNRIVGGHVAFDGTGNRFAYNNITGTDARSSPGHIVSTSANSEFDHNTFWNVDLTTDSGILTYMNYGNVHVTDNRMFLGCYGNNCMAIETINMQAAQESITPNWPTVEIARNRIDWVAIAAGGWAIGLDNEFSEREWLHDNTFISTDPGGAAAGNALQGGGVENSVYENNTDYGPTTFCIYEYIYESAGNLFQNNTCNHSDIGGIFQTGGNVYRNNVFNDVHQVGLFLCTPGPCAGSTANTIANAWYNNTFHLANGASLVQLDLSNALTNTMIAHGGTAWTDGNGSHPIYGDWLFWANASIGHLAFSDTSNGRRTLTMATGGRSYWDTEPVSGVADTGAIAVDGAIDARGSLYGGTVLGSLNPYGRTSLTVTATGPISFTLTGFAPNYRYNDTVAGSGGSTTGTVTTDSSGTATIPVDFGSTSSQRTLTVWGSPTPPPTPPPPSPPPSSPPPADTTPPATTTDLAVRAGGSTWALLTWTAPGNNGTVGTASEYDLRMSDVGPVTNADFVTATRIPTPPPDPAGTTEFLNVTGLFPGTHYYFALRTADSVPNWSNLSDTASFTTAAQGDNGSLPPPPGSPPGPPSPPSILSATYDGGAQAVDLLFSQAMDQAAVNASVQVFPPVPYHVVWVDDAHLRIVFDGPIDADASYALLLSRAATDRTGTPIATPYAYLFAGGPGPASNSMGTVLLGGFTAATVVLWIAAAASKRSRRRVRRAVWTVVGPFWSHIRGPRRPAAIRS